ncbi:MAG: malonyl-CoA decarboxylase [Dongiaceae bacterium]
MNETIPVSFFDRTVSNLRNAWRDIAARALSSSGAVALRPDLPDDDVLRLRRQIAECLDNRGGEVTARGRAAEIGRAYLGLSPAGRQRFLQVLARDFGLDRERVHEAIRGYQEADEPAMAADAESGLREALVSPRLRLLKQFTALPDGFKFLVDLRAELLDHLSEDRAMVALDRDLQTLFNAWFDIGLLDLRRITWDSPTSLLEKLIAYEAVHEIRSWDDLKNRLDSDRRCYAFFHPRMPGEPLIFVEVALVGGMADNIQGLLDESAPREDAHNVDAAIFYSISNTQKGLRGISFGDFLIKQVVEDLSQSLPALKTFATLSPVPGFRNWLERKLAEGEPKLLTSAEHAKLKAVAPVRAGKGGLRALLERPGWASDPVASEALAVPLRRLCARYLVLEKSNGKPLDTVARFHLANGARLERVNWLADSSAKGLQESAGIMVNYLYRLSDIEANHETYAALGKVAVSPAVKALLKS